MKPKTAIQAAPPLAVPSPSHSASPIQATPTPEGAEAANITPSGSSTPSTDELASRSPVFIRQNDPGNERQLHPTAGDREFIAEDLKAPWKFAGVLHQRPFGAFHSEGPRMPPRSNYLYVQFGSDGHISDQLAVKCLDLRDSDVEHLARNEIEYAKRLQTVNCKHILRYRGSAERSRMKGLALPSDKAIEMKTAYIYTDFAALGSLREISGAHTGRHLVSEHFIWYVLSQLTEGLITMQGGICLPNEGPGGTTTSSPLGPWEPIIHSDIKEDNIFLCRNNSTYPSYPTVVLANFDCAMGLDEVSEQRFFGTRGWQPPERNIYDEELTEHAPKTWEVSEKSDIWSVALVAWGLMRAYPEDIGNVHAANRQECESWHRVEELKNGTVTTQDGAFPVELDNLPTGYSVDLCRLVEHCLRYHPSVRPSLQDMKAEIDKNLAKLDRMYGDEVRKSHDTIASDFHLLYTEEYEQWDAFAIDQPHQPLKKRREISDAGDSTADHATLVTEWENTVTYPQPNVEEQGRALDLLDNYLTQSPQGEGVDKCWQYLFTCMRLRTASDAAVYSFTSITAEGREAFDSETKIEVLKALRDNVLENVQEEEEEAAALQHSFQVLHHVLGWGLLLLELGAVPSTPRLRGKTEMHRGMEDFVFIRPEGAFSIDF